MTLRRLLALILGSLLLLLAILVGNTVRKGRAAPGPGNPSTLEAPLEPPLEPINAERVASHLAQAIRIRTVSHQEAKDDDAAQFEAFYQLLVATYPRISASLTKEAIAGGGLLYTWKGTEGRDAGAHGVLLAAHMDVVPVEPGTEGDWSHPAFDGVIDSGYVWGRGALDDKGALIQIMEAVESLLEQGWSPRRTVYLAFGADEEVGGTRGAQVMAGLLAARGVHLDFVLDEGMMVTDGIVAEIRERVALIGIAEKGYVSLELTARVEGGHSSMPPPETAIGLLSSALDRLGHKPLPARLEGASRQMLETLALSMPFSRRVLMSNLWLTSPLVLRLLSKKPSTNAQVRTTMAPTIFEAGVKENVLPKRARAVINLRILPGDTALGVMDQVRAIVSDERIEIKRLPGMVSDPSAASSTTSPDFAVIAGAIRACFPGAVVSPALVVGATDARHYEKVAANLYRFAPFVVRAEDLQRIHGTDERVAIDQLAGAVHAYQLILREGK